MAVRKILRTLLPSQLKQWLHQQADNLNRLTMRLFAHFRWTSSLYYGLFSGKFSREHFGVLQGRVQYQKSLSADKKSYALLRRNTHRLEKGLIMRPRRASFAADYIGETVTMFLRAQQSSQISHVELTWAHDVLSEYFAVVEDTAKIKQARELWETRKSHDNSTKVKNQKSVPYQRSNSAMSDISADQLEQLFLRRRSVRWYLPQQVPQELIERAINMASLAPSACNRQPYEFYYISDQAQAAKVAGFAGGTVGFSQQVQNLIVVVGDLSAYPYERDRHCIYIDGALASMQLMLAAETLGLATCPINWPDVEHRERAMEKELKLAPHQRPIMLISIGYADPEGGIAYSAKKDAEVLLKTCD